MNTLFAGLATVDVEYGVTHLPGSNEKIAAGYQRVSAGGPAANAAITSAFLGSNAALITALGQHPVSGLIRTELQSFCVRVHDLAPASTNPPPVSAVMVLPDGQRSIVSANAKAFTGTLSDVDEQWLEACELLLVDGHYIEIAVHLAAKARAQGLDVVLDGGSWKPGMDELLRFVTIAICSDDFRPPGCGSTGEAMAFLESLHIPRIAITRGGNSILYRDHKGTGEIPVRTVSAVDTSGAGDIFHGAFCRAFPEADFPAALHYAAEVASFSCRFPGTRAWMAEFKMPT